jgi:hypothetical protein
MAEVAFVKRFHSKPPIVDKSSRTPCGAYLKHHARH